MKEPKICLRPECGQPAKTRGLCQRCYAAAGTLVKEGKVKWEELVAQGKALDAKRWFGNSAGPARLWFLGNQTDNGKVVVEAKSKSPRQVVVARAKELAGALSPPMPIVNITPHPNSNIGAPVVVEPQTKALPICFDCNEPLTGQFAKTRGGQTLCVPCAQARAKSNVPTRLE